MASAKTAIGLALSGGGARGVAHIGVLEALEELPVKIGAIAGTSAGAIVGAMYAATQDTEWMDRRFHEFLDTESYRRLGMDRLAGSRASDPPWLGLAQRIRNHIVLNVSLVKAFAIKKSRLVDALRFLVPVTQFEELKIPLTVVASDLVSGQDASYRSGDLIEALARSASIPGFLEPTRDGDALLVDGGVTNPMPVNFLRPQYEYVVGVDIGRPPGECKEALNMYELMMRAEAMKHQRLHRHLVDSADFVVRPQVGDVHWSRFDRIDVLIDAGRRAGADMRRALAQEMADRNRPTARLRRALADRLRPA